MQTRRKRGEAREQVFEFVRRRLLEGESPTVREVQQALGFSAVQSAQQHLESLVGEGKLARTERGIELPQMPAPAQLVPLLGRVQAGAPVLAAENIEGYLPASIDASLPGRKRAGQLFALRVRGQSMKLAGILEGDVVIVRRQQRCESGDVVVALLGDEATVKTLRLRGTKAELLPANPDFAPIQVRLGELVLLGKVIELRRDLEQPRALK